MPLVKLEQILNFHGALAADASSATTKAAAPSLSVEALPAVTVPSLSKTVRSLPKPSLVVSARTPSSVSTTVSPFRDLIVTGTISSANAPSLRHRIRRENTVMVRTPTRAKLA